MSDVIPETETKTTQQLLGEGIRAFIVQDFDVAVQALSTASELLVKEHGDDLHESLGDVYLYYGKALLGLSRAESEALGDAVPQTAEDESDGDDDYVEPEGEVEAEGDVEAEAAPSTEEKEAEENVEVSQPLEPVETSDKMESEGEVKVAEGVEKEGVDENEAGPSEEKTDEPEELTDLQLAWEVLELAKQIFTKKGEEGKKNLAETLVVLGEISLESENFESAITDIKEALRLQKTLFSNDSRAVAETNYKLGMAHATISQIDEAVVSFNESVQYLKNRIETLGKIEEKKDSVDEEIAEIKELLPEIEEKIADMHSYKDEAIKKLLSAAMASPKTNGAATSDNSKSDKAPTDISHLVKRKRKVEDAKDESAANPPKKVSP